MLINDTSSFLFYILYFDMSIKGKIGQIVSLLLAVVETSIPTTLPPKVLKVRELVVQHYGSEKSTRKIAGIIKSRYSTEQQINE